jgi:single-strand DNA-binding protein
VLIEGKIRHRDYEAQDGTKRYITEIHADSMELLGSPANQSNDNRFAGQPVNNISAPVDLAGSADDMNPKDDLPF